MTGEPRRSSLCNTSVIVYFKVPTWYLINFVLCAPRTAMLEVAMRTRSCLGLVCFATSWTLWLDAIAADHANIGLNLPANVLLDLPESLVPAPLLVFASGCCGIQPDGYQWLVDEKLHAVIVRLPYKQGPHAAHIAQTLTVASKESSSILYGRLSGVLILGAHSAGGRAALHEMAKWKAARTSVFLGLLLLAPEVEAVPLSVLQEITMPVLQITGAIDCIHPPSLHAAQREGMQGAHNALLVVRGANHQGWSVVDQESLPSPSTSTWCDGVLSSSEQQQVGMVAIAAFAKTLQDMAQQADPHGEVARVRSIKTSAGQAWTQFEQVLHREQFLGKWWSVPRGVRLPARHERSMRECCCAADAVPFTFRGLVHASDRPKRPAVCWEGYVERWSGHASFDPPGVASSQVDGHPPLGMCFANHYYDWTPLQYAFGVRIWDECYV